MDITVYDCLTMEKVIKLTQVTPKVELTKSEYDRLVSLAQANADEIEKRAVEYYKKNGVCNIHIDAHIRSSNYYGSGNLADTFRLDCQPQNVYVIPSDEHNPFAIDEKTRKRIMKFASDYVNSIFTNNFGEHLKHINNAKWYEHCAKRNWHIWKAFTSAGWLLAFVMFIIAILT